MPWGYCRKRSEKHGTQFHATKLRLFLNIVYFFPDIFENNPFHRLLSYFFSPIPCIHPLESRCPFLPKEEMFGLAAIHSPSDFACILTFFIYSPSLFCFQRILHWHKDEYKNTDNPDSPCTTVDLRQEHTTYQPLNLDDISVHNMVDWKNTKQTEFSVNGYPSATNESKTQTKSRQKAWILASERRKHRTSCTKTSELSRQNIGTFPQRSPMFLISGTGKNDSYGSLYGVFYKLGWGDFRLLRNRF